MVGFGFGSMANEKFNKVTLATFSFTFVFSRLFYWAEIFISTAPSFFLYLRLPAFSSVYNAIYEFLVENVNIYLAMATALIAMKITNRLPISKRVGIIDGKRTVKSSIFHLIIRNVNEAKQVNGKNSLGKQIKNV